MSAALIKLGLLMLSMAPLLISNVRTGLAKNALLGLLLAIGVLAAVLRPVYGDEPLKLSSLVIWVFAAILLIGISASGIIGGGVAKLLIALLPWFSFGHYLLTITLGMLLAAVVGWIKGRAALIVPPMAFASALAALMPVIGISL
jgi:hypothetical protein